MSQSPKTKDQILKQIGFLESRLRILEEQKNTLVISYMTLRTAIGVLGMSLPVVVSLGAWLIFATGLQSSISAYYHTGMRDVLVGALWAAGFFLFSYRGYSLVDEIAGKLACLFAVGVAIFPASPDGATDPIVLRIGTVHFVFSALFFLTLIFFSLFLFTQTDPHKPPTPRKLWRNRIYRICGFVMLLYVLFIGVYTVLPPDLAAVLAVYHPIYWLEALAIFTFGVSWFTKGEGILKDEEIAPRRA